MAGNPVVDWLNMLGPTLTGLALLLGVSRSGTLRIHACGDCVPCSSDPDPDPSGASPRAGPTVVVRNRSHPVPGAADAVVVPSVSGTQPGRVTVVSLTAA